jgi:hypothetical protein
VRARVFVAAAPTDPEPVTEIGSPVRISYEVENTSGVPVKLWHAGFWPNHRIVVTDPSGAAPPLTPQGKAGFDAFSPRGPRDKNVEWIIPPQKVDKSEGDYDLTDLADLSAPGRYTVRIDYEEDIAFSSNTLPFWRLRAGGRAPLNRLDGWDKDELDTLERPAAHSEQTASGETRSFVAAQKDELHRLGVEVVWDPSARRYRIVSAR